MKPVQLVEKLDQARVALYDGIVDEMEYCRWVAAIMDGNVHTALSSLPPSVVIKSRWAAEARNQSGVR